MVLNAVKSLFTRQLRHSFKFRSFLLSPIKCAFGRIKVSRKPTAKLAIKPASVQFATKTPKLSRRKRVASPGYSSKQAVLVPRPKHKAPATMLPLQAIRSAKVLQSRDRPPPVLDLSINEFYRAAHRAISKSPRKNREDEAMLGKLRRAAYRHEMIAGIKVFEKRIDKNNAETKARREKERRAKLIKEYRRKVATKKLKDRLFELVETAERGEKLDVPEPSSTEVAAWTSYDANWKAILDGNLEKLISLDVFPCPTLKAKKIALEDYEEFLISPVRTGYEKLNFYERAAKEQELWDEEHIAEKVLPFVEEESRERVVRGAGAIRGYLERIIAKFNACEW